MAEKRLRDDSCSNVACNKMENFLDITGGCAWKSATAAFAYRIEIR